MTPGQAGEEAPAASEQLSRAAQGSSSPLRRGPAEEKAEAAKGFDGPSPEAELSYDAFRKENLPRKILILKRLAADNPGLAADWISRTVVAKEERLEVRIAALQALETLPPRARGTILRKALHDAGDWYLRFEAARGLARPEIRPPPPPPGELAALASLYEDEKANPSLRRAVGALLLGWGQSLPSPEFGALATRGVPRWLERAWHKALARLNWRYAGKAVLAVLLGAALLGASSFAFASVRSAFFPSSVMAASLESAEAPAFQPEASTQGEAGEAASGAQAKAAPSRDPGEEIAERLKRFEEEDEAQRSSGIGFLGWLMVGMFVIAVIGLVLAVMQMSGRAFLFDFDDKVGREKPRTRFKDVAGIEDALTEVREVAEYIKNPEPFRGIGAKMPRGLLLEGPPGTGKTLLARALAGEAEAEFLSTSGSNFVEVFVGRGAARVRKLFSQARSIAAETGRPVLIFIDEIDAVGSQRSGVKSSLTGNDEREQTLNQLLAEMDGFSKSERIFVLAATNRADKLDQALRRPGRFDSIIHVGLPDPIGREAILAVHAAGVQLSPEADLRLAAQRSSGLSGAFLADIVNKAALYAVRRGAEAIAMADLNKAVDAATIGGERSTYVSPDLKRKISIHEIGHTLPALALGLKVNKVTNIPHGSGVLGFAESDFGEDKLLYTREELGKRLVISLGSLAAEDLYFGGDTTSGVGNDLERATEIAENMVQRFGMRREQAGLRVTAQDEGPFAARKVSEATAQKIDAEVEALLREAYEKARRLIEAQREAFDALVLALIQRETLSREEIEALYRLNLRPTA